MKRTLFSSILLIFLIGLVSAGSTVYYNMDSGDDYVYKEKISKTYYDDDDDYTITRTIYLNYDNDDRYSTYDYRHGYSYRNTRDYWVRHHDYRDVEDVKVIVTDEDYWYRQQRYSDRDYDSRYRGHDSRYRDYDSRYRDYDPYYRYRYSDRPSLRYKYYPYMDRYEEFECYEAAPRGKLFYYSCDDWLY